MEKHVGGQREVRDAGDDEEEFGTKAEEKIEDVRERGSKVSEGVNAGERGLASPERREE